MRKLLLLMMLYWCSSTFSQNTKVILIVLAHPDDETAMGSVIHKLTQENKTILITAADGRYGKRSHAGNLEGDTLAAIRKKELICSCKELGIDSLIQLGYHDGMGGRTSVREYFTQTNKIKEDIKMLLEIIKPDFIITFGPDGDTGHSDHRNIGNLVTEILLREKWVEKYPLYFFAWTKQLSENFGGVNYVADDYLNVAIAFSEEDEKANQRAIQCHWSQFTSQEIKDGFDADTKDKTNTLYFRRFTVTKGINKDFL